jgi:hypothetical protein
MRSPSLLLASAMIATLGFVGSHLTASASGVVTFFAVLNGQNVCDGGSPPQCHEGDWNGHGAATILLIPGPTPTVCFAIVINRIAVVIGAHIHSGASGANGEIVITLPRPVAPRPSYTDGWGGCVSGADVTAEEINQIRANPQNFYVNLHASGHGNSYPYGAIRGQLF